MFVAADISFYRDASLLREEGERPEVAAALDCVADQIWGKDPNYWRGDALLFRQDSGILVARSNSDPIGFLVYQRLQLSFGRVFNIRGVNVLPHHQGKGLMLRFFQTVVKHEQPTAAGSSYVAARTRSPVVLSICSRLCSSLLPSIASAAYSAGLLEHAREAAVSLLPDTTFEEPSMIIRGAYSDFHYKTPQHHRDARAEAAVFHNDRLGETDAFFVFGEMSEMSRVFT
jgi:hypothetical protein